MVRLKTTGFAYLPLGYRHGVNNQGHEITIKFEQKKHSVHVAIINLGDGCELNPLLDMTPSQEKLSYRYFPIEISNSVFKGEKGIVSLCHLVRYRTDPPSPRCWAYTGSDTYDIFLTLGKPILDLGEDPEKYIAKVKQRSGKCADKGVKCAVSDLLVERAPYLSRADKKKVILNLHFRSLMRGYHTYMRKPTRETREQLRNAAETFGRHVDKLYHDLNETEILGATAVIHEILRKTKRIPESSAAGAGSSSFIVDVSEKLDIDPALTKLLHAQRNKQIPIAKAQQKQKHVKIKKPSSFDLAHFPEQLQIWTNLIASVNPGPERFELLSECVKMIPLPVWGSSI